MLQSWWPMTNHSPAPTLYPSALCPAVSKGGSRLAWKYQYCPTRECSCSQQAHLSEVLLCLSPSPMSHGIFRSIQKRQALSTVFGRCLSFNRIYQTVLDQKTIRAELYDRLRDTLRGVQNVDASQMGKR